MQMEVSEPDQGVMLSGPAVYCTAQRKKWLITREFDNSFFIFM